MTRDDDRTRAPERERDVAATLRERACDRVTCGREHAAIRRGRERHRHHERVALDGCNTWNLRAALIDARHHRRDAIRRITRERQCHPQSHAARGERTLPGAEVSVDAAGGGDGRGLRVRDAPGKEHSHSECSHATNLRNPGRGAPS